MTTFTSRYGNPAVDYKGAHIWAYCRHGATVVAVSGRIDAANVARVTDYAVRFISDDIPFVLDLSRVTAFTPRATRLLDAADERCRAAGVAWALVPGEFVAGLLQGRPDAADLPVMGTVAEAEHQFDDAVLRRRRLLLPLLSKTA